MPSQRILLVEDEVLISFAFEAVLTDAGYDVLTAPDGPSALAELERDPARFDCLITDIRLPGMDGWSVAKRVRELRPDLPVIYTTGDSHDEWGTRGVSDSSVLKKPFKLDDAVTHVGEVLTR